MHGLNAEEQHFTN